MTAEEAFRILRSLPQEWGASEEEVRETESRLGVRLPPPIRELMLCTGRGRHMHWLFPDGEIPPLDALSGLQDLAQEILEGDPPELRPAFPFVTLSVPDGYGFYFVRADRFDIDATLKWYQEGHGFAPGDGWAIRQDIAAAVRRSLARA